MPRDTSWLLDIIATIASQRFEEMTLWFGNGTCKGWVKRFDFQSLEHSLIHRTDPPTLPVVNVKFMQTGRWTDADDCWLILEVEQQLPVLHEQGFLVVYPKGMPYSGAFDGWWPYRSW